MTVNESDRIYDAVAEMLLTIADSSAELLLCATCQNIKDSLIDLVCDVIGSDAAEDLEILYDERVDELQED